MRVKLIICNQRANLQLFPTSFNSWTQTQDMSDDVRIDKNLRYFLQLCFTDVRCSSSPLFAFEWEWSQPLKKWLRFLTHGQSVCTFLGPCLIRIEKVASPAHFLTRNYESKQRNFKMREFNNKFRIKTSVVSGYRIKFCQNNLAIWGLY